MQASRSLRRTVLCKNAEQTINVGAFWMETLKLCSYSGWKTMIDTKKLAYKKQAGLAARAACKFDISHRFLILYHLSSPFVSRTSELQNRISHAQPETVGAVQKEMENNARAIRHVIKIAIFPSRRPATETEKWIWRYLRWKSCVSLWSKITRACFHRDKKWRH